MAPRSQPAKKPSTTLQDATNPPPNWPLIEFAPPPDDLSLDVLLHDQILTISNLWTSNQCKTYVNFLRTLPMATTPGKPRRGEAVRVNDRYQIDDPAFAEQLWSRTALEQILQNPATGCQTLSEDDKCELWGGELLGLSPNIRIYRYSKGQFFDQHYDESNTIMFPCATDYNAIRAKTTWTLLLYLSSPATGCQGGETVFYPEPPTKRAAPPPPIIADLEVGMVLLHRHGKDCLLHEGREVTGGEKWVIRSDLCVKA